MIAGHFGLAAGVKSQERSIPLWALMLATSWLDVIFVPLYLLGVETIEKAPDATGPYGGSIIHANYTHSLLGAAILSFVFGWFFSRRWGERAGIVLGAVSFSHWILDLVVHRGDLRPGGVDSYFDAYFLNGTLPKTDTVHVSQLGDPTPPASAKSGKAGAQTE